MSILNFPERGPWGRASWPGNCSGHVVRELIDRVRPSVFVDAMCGSGSGVQAAKSAAVAEAVGLDLHNGFDCLRMSIAERLTRPADLAWCHPPYGGCIRYSGHVWGDRPHPSDLSHAEDDEHFHGMLQTALLNLRDATAPGGTYACLIGDWRSNGRYVSYQAEMIARMPRDELAAVLIKAQHNTTSGRRTYRAMRWPMIEHEYLVVWTKPRTVQCALATLRTLATQASRTLRTTWRAMVHASLVALGGRATTQELYDAMSRDAEDRIKAAPNWRAKVRQVLQVSREFVNVERGVWALA